MKGLAELVLSLCDLAEAEGRALRRTAVLAGQGCALSFAAVLCIIAALAFITGASYDILIRFMPRYLVLLLLAGINAIFALLLFWSAKKCMPAKTGKQAKKLPKKPKS